MPIYEYQCRNEGCGYHKDPLTRVFSLDTKQVITCEMSGCDGLMDRLISRPARVGAKKDRPERVIESLDEIRDMDLTEAVDVSLTPIADPETGEIQELPVGAKLGVSQRRYGVSPLTGYDFEITEKKDDGTYKAEISHADDTVIEDTGEEN
ncbi:hypothetical protein ACFLZX_03325 [Nanoarchaeota archaeon]